MNLARVKVFEIAVLGIEGSPLLFCLIFSLKTLFLGYFSHLQDSKNCNPFCLFFDPAGIFLTSGLVIQV